MLIKTTTVEMSDSSTPAEVVGEMVVDQLMTIFDLHFEAFKADVKRFYPGATVYQED
jgi:hypothetical protein